MSVRRLSYNEIKKHYDNVDVSNYPILIIFKSELLPEKPAVNNTTGSGMYNARKVKVNGVIYESIAAASRAFGTPYADASRRALRGVRGWKLI